jgi:hypothetical protein
MSQKQEPQGQIVFPIQLVQWDEDGADAVITVFHHPDRWMESNNSRPFREYIERTSNIIITGHEHHADRYIKYNKAGAVNDYVEGSALQDSDNPWVSGFNLIELNFDSREKRVLAYNLVKGAYNLTEESEWKPFEHTLSSRVKGFSNNPNFANWLIETGLPLSHKSQHTLTLPDIFIYPDLDSIPLDKKRDDATIDLIIPSERVLNFALEYPLLIVTGSDQAGKTSLAKIVYRDFLGRGLVPVLINGAHVKNVREEDLLRIVDREFERQYGRGKLDRYQQLPPNRRILIIDDFDHTSIRSREGHSMIIEILRRHFDKIIIFASDIFQFEELSQGAESESSLNAFRHVAIREFSNQLRTKLITKWVTFDRDFAVSDQELEHEINDHANKASTLLLRKTVPSYPVILLSMLQMFDLNQEVADKGEFGYFYESYILQKLAQNKTQSIEMGTIRGFATYLAYKLFEDKSRTIGEAELTEFTQH